MFTVIVGKVPSEYARALDNVDQSKFVAIYRKAHRSARAAARNLASLINGRTERSKAVHRQIGMGEYGYWFVETPNGNLSLFELRQQTLSTPLCARAGEIETSVSGQIDRIRIFLALGFDEDHIEHTLNMCE